MSVRRLDSGTLAAPQRLPNGWVRADAYLSRTGVQTYLDEDGKPRREYRPPEEVFNADSLASFASVPVTDGHPPVFLDASNAAEYTKGATETPAADGTKTRAKLLVTDAALIAKMDGKKKLQVSLGYQCELEMKPGVTPSGEKYDAVQRNIRGNHVAIVPVGRAGPEVRVRMDALEAEDEVTNPPEKKTMTFKARIDGITYEFTTEQGQQAFEKYEKTQTAALEAARKDAADAKATAEKVQAKLDEATDTLKKRDEEIKAMPAKLRADMSARAALEAKAKKVLGDDVKLDGLDTKAVQLKVLEQLKPDKKFDGKSAEYIESRFDAAVEAFDEEDGFDASVKKLDADGDDDKATKPGARFDENKARADFMHATENAWRRDTKGA